jgi:multidrug resistance efflux pump
MKRQRSRNNHAVKRYRLRHLVPVIVWLLALATVVGLLYQRAQRFTMVGMARGEVRQIAASSTGRIRSIPIDLFQPVSAGQTLAVVDTILDNEQILEAQLRAELASVTAEIEHLAAQLVPTQELMSAEAANLELTRAGDLRRFSGDIENARLQILQLQASLASDQITLRELSTEAKILEKLVEEEALAPYEMEKVRGQHESLAKKIVENEKLLAQAKADLEETKRRREAFERREVSQPSVDHALEVIRKQIKVQEELMRGLLQQLQALRSRETVALKSPIDGVVIPIASQENDALHQRPGEHVVRRIGEVVRAGDPILAVAQTEPTEIVAYISDQQLGSVGEKTTVRLIKNRAPAQIAESRVSSIGPTMELMPQRLWRNPTIPQWGRPVLIGIPPGLILVPGEIVGIRGL